MNNNYQNGKIYIINCNTTGQKYIGSTTNELDVRLKQHEYKYYSYLKKPTSSVASVFEVLKANNYNIELLQAYPCENKLELESLESFHQKKIECVNKINALGKHRKIVEGNQYHNGKIYIITCHTTEKVYIGSTICDLEKRLNGHRGNYFAYLRNSNNGFTTSFECLEANNYTIGLLEAFSCENKSELERREGFHQRNIECVNKQIAGRTQKEYHQDHKEEINARNKIYRENNREMLKLRSREYRNNNKEKIKENRKANYDKEKRSLIYQANREKVLLQSKLYHENNKEKVKARYQKNKVQIAQRKKVKYTCACGSSIRLDGKNRHEKSKKHINFISSD